MTGSFLGGASMVATVLRVRDVAASVTWYREKLGLEPLHVGSDGPDHPITAFSFAGSVVSLWQLPRGERRTREDNDRNAYVVAVMNEDLEGLRRVLVDRGVEVGEVRRSANNQFLWFYDPDGNRFELSRPVTAELREAAEQVRLADAGPESRASATTPTGRAGFKAAVAAVRADRDSR